MNRKEMNSGDKKEDPRFASSQHLSRLQQYSDVQALLSPHHDRRNSSDLQSLLSSSGGLGLSARSGSSFPPMMEIAVMQQRLALQEETRLRMMSQLEAGSSAMRSPTLAPLKSSERESSSLDMTSESNESQLQSHLRKRSRHDFKEERRYARKLPSRVLGGGRPGSLGDAVLKMLSMKRNDFPLPSLKTALPRRNAPLVSLVSHQDKWDSLSGKLRRFEGRVGPVETKRLVRELFGRAVQFKTALSTRKNAAEINDSAMGFD